MTAIPAAAHRPPRTRGRRVRRAVRAVTATAAVALLARVVIDGWDGLTAAATALWQQQPTTLALVAALVATWIVALAEVQRTSAGVVGAVVSRRDALRITRGAFTLSRVVPGGGAAGGVFAVRELARLGHRPGVAAGTAVVSWGAASVTFGVIAVAAAGSVVADRTLPFAVLAPGIAVVVTLGLVGALTLWAVRDPQARTRAIRWLSPPPGRNGRLRRRVATVRSRLATAVADLDRPVAPVHRLRSVIAWSVAANVCEVATLWTVFAAVGAPLPLPALAAGYLAASALNAAPEVTPGWIGVYEVTVAAAYTALGVPADTAVVAVLLHRLVAFWVPVGIGIVPAVRSLTAGRGGRSVPPAGSGATSASARPELEVAA